MRLFCMQLGYKTIGQLYGVKAKDLNANGYQKKQKQQQLVDLIRSFNDDDDHSVGNYYYFYNRCRCANAATGLCLCTFIVSIVIVYYVEHG